MREKWYALGPDETIKLLTTDIVKGLAGSEAEDRLRKYGENKLPEKKRQSFFIRFFKHFHDILIYVLFISAMWI